MKSVLEDNSGLTLVGGYVRLMRLCMDLRMADTRERLKRKVERGGDDNDSSRHLMTAYANQK